MSAPEFKLTGEKLLKTAVNQILQHSETWQQSCSRWQKTHAVCDMIFSPIFPVTTGQSGAGAAQIKLICTPNANERALHNRRSLRGQINAGHRVMFGPAVLAAMGGSPVRTVQPVKIVLNPRITAVRNSQRTCPAGTVQKSINATMKTETYKPTREVAVKVVETVNCGCGSFNFGRFEISGL